MFSLHGSRHIVIDVHSTGTTQLSDLALVINIHKNKYQSVDYKNCMYQNYKHFGFIPLNYLMAYTGQEVIWAKSLIW